MAEGNNKAVSEYNVTAFYIVNGSVQGLTVSCLGFLLFGEEDDPRSRRAVIEARHWPAACFVEAHV
jgi:hypothetical protein